VDCSHVCLYAQTSLTQPLLSLVHPLPSPAHRPTTLYEYDYPSAGVDVPNGLLSALPHPSDLVVGSYGVAHSHLAADAVVKDSTWARRDDHAVLGTRNGETMVASVVGRSPLPYEADLIGKGVAYGVSNCEWLRVCDPAQEWVGSLCKLQRHGLTLEGYCFESSAGSLECGRTVSIDGPAQKNPVQTTDAPRRCPRGTPLQRFGVVSARRLLLAGCMLSTDVSYDPLAEVHVQQVCTSPRLSWLVTGCLFHGAVNYNPLASQSGPCVYRTKGCTNRNALNYNSDATIDDGSCVQPTYGCTLPTAGYALVAPDTPGYKSLYVGVPLTGRVAWPAYGSVLHRDPLANTLANCTIAIEGCMDPEAVNFNPDATVSSTTWCVPKRLGCMMPLQISTQQQQQVTLFPGAANYDPAATVHDLSSCIPALLGCTQSSALNYDPQANVNDGHCVNAYPGCLDPSARNFNCTARGETPCRADVPRASVHSADACQYQPTPSSPSPPPPLPPCSGDCDLGYTLTCQFVAHGEVADVDTTEAKAVLAAAFASAVGDAGGEDISDSDILVQVEAASVLVTITITARSGAHVQAMQTALQPHLATAQNASAFVGMPVQSVPLVSIQTAIVSAPPGPAGLFSSPEAWGVAAVLIVLVLLIAGLTVWALRNPGKLKEALRAARAFVRVPVPPAAIAPYKPDATCRASQIAASSAAIDTAAADRAAAREAADRLAANKVALVRLTAQPHVQHSSAPTVAVRSF